MTQQDALAFCERWLAAWTGNQPDALLAFYAEDALYRDPAFPGGLQGYTALRPYFTKLLAANPEWVWKAVEAHQTPQGFTLKWHARIPTPSGTVEEDGLDIVELADGRITRNEVYFDRAALLAAHAKARAKP